MHLRTFCGLLAALGAAAQAQQPLRVAMTGSYWPLHATGPEEHGRYGLEADLAQALGNELGTGVTYLTKEEIGSGGSIQAVVEGRADIAINAITPTEERRALVDFTAPYLTLQFRIAVRAGQPAPQSLEAFAGKKGAAPKGPAYDLAHEKLPTADLQAVTGLTAGAKLLKAKKIDFLVGEDVGLQELVEQNKGLEIVAPPVGPSPLAAAVPKGSAAKYDGAFGRIAGIASKLQQLYKPGSPISPKILVVTNCKHQGVMDQGYGRVSVEGAPRAGPLEGQAGTSWFYFDNRLSAAPSVDNTLPPEEETLCVSAPVRFISTPPFGQAALDKANAQLKRTNRGADWELTPNAPAWFQLADGGFGTAVPWSRTGGCSKDEESCSEGGYLVVVAKGRSISSTHFTIRSVSTPKEPEGT